MDKTANFVGFRSFPLCFIFTFNVYLCVFFFGLNTANLSTENEFDPLSSSFWLGCVECV